MSRAILCIALQNSLASLPPDQRQEIAERILRELATIGGQYVWIPQSMKPVDRSAEIIDARAAGKSYRIIAAELHVSQREIAAALLPNSQCIGSK